MKKTKTSIFVLIITLTTASGISAGWGVITEDTDAKLDSLEKKYTLGLVNTGDEAVVLEFKATQSQDYNVSFDEKRIRLEPSTTTRNPSGSGWFYSGNGEYVKVKYTSFKLTASSERSSNNLEFNITVSEAPNLNPLNRNVPRQSIINQRNFEYEVNLDETLVKGLNDEKDSIWDEANSEEFEDNSEREKKIDSKGSRKTDNTSDKIENNIEKEDKGINNTTLVLLVMLTSTVTYLLY